MTSNEYNVRMVLFFSLVILGVICLTIILIKEGQLLGWFKTHFIIYKYVLIIISIILCIVLLLYIISGIVGKDEEISKVEIIDVLYNGSYAGIMDTCSLYVKFTDDTYIWLSTPLFSSETLSKTTENLKIGDIVIIKYISSTQIVYNIETQRGGSSVSNKSNN